MNTKHVPLRLEPGLHSWLVRKAASERRSINGHVTWLIEQEKAADEVAGKTVNPEDTGLRGTDLDKMVPGIE